MKTDIKKEMRELMTLTPENVLEVFNRQLNIYRVTKSNSVVIDGEELNSLERSLFLVFGRYDEDGNNTIKSIEISNIDKDGFPITYERFIKDQLNKYEPLYLETITSRQYSTENLRAKTYIDFLKSYKTDEKKENKKKAGQKAIPKLSAEQYLLVSEDDKQRFLDRLKEKFKDEGKKEFCYLLIGLNELKLLNAESQQNVFDVITKYFGGYYGRYSNFNKHWRNPNDKNLLEMTKTQIINIKRVYIIM